MSQAEDISIIKRASAFYGNNRAVLCWLSLLGVSAAFALGACSEDTEPESDVSSTTVPAAVETTTTTAPATTTTAPATTTTTIPTAVGFEVSIGDDTVWWDVLDNLAEAEQECIFEALGDELEAVMDLAVLSGDDEAWQAPLLACLDPDTARELYLTIIIASIEEDFMADVDPQEEACLREHLSDEDLPAVAAEPEDPEAIADFLDGMVSCVPEVFVSLFMEGMLGATDAAGLDLREEQVSCLQDAVVGIDWVMLSDGDPEAIADFLDGMVSCVPEVFVSLFMEGMEVEAGDLSDEARSCLRELVIDLDWVMFSDGPEPEDPEAIADFLDGMVSCVPEVFVSLFMEGMEVEAGDLSDEARSCLRELVIDLDWVMFSDGPEPEDPEAIADFLDGMVSCVPEVFVSLFMEGMLGATDAAGLDLREEQASCLQDAVVGIDWVMSSDGPEPEDPEAIADFLDGMVSCVPEVFVSLFMEGMEVEAGDLSDEARSCLRELVIDLDWSAILGGAEDDILAEFVPGLIGCAPELLFLDDEAVLSGGDDHGDLIDEATPATLGEATGAPGVLEWGDDIDVFVFEAVAGELYQIDVAPGTLEDPTVELYDADGLWLAYNDDHGNTLASRLYWEATNSGPHYVAVSGYGTGTYTLTIAQR